MNKGARTREKIIEAALEEASRKGLDALTIGGLASALGMSKSGLFSHFGSKEALQKAVIEEIAETFKATVAVPALAIPPGRARIVALFENWIAWSAAPERPGGCSMAAAAFEYDARPGEIRDAVAEMFQQWRAFLAASVQEAQSVDLNPTLNPEAVASSIVSFYLGQHLERWLLGEAEAGRRALARLEELLS